MTSASRQEVWASLQAQGLVSGDLPAAPVSSSPWFVRVMLGVAGWIGALFLLGFIGVLMSSIFKSPTAAIAVGLMCCAGAYAIFRAAPHNDFAGQFGIAVSLAGQALFVFGVFDGLDGDKPMAYFTVFLFEGALALLLPSQIHRFLTAGGAAMAFSFGLGKIGLPAIAPAATAATLALIWLNEERWAARGSFWRPLGYALACTLLSLEAFHLFGFGRFFMRPENDAGWLVFSYWLRTGLMSLVLVWASLRFLSQQQTGWRTREGMLALAGALAVCALSFVTPGLAAALLVLLIGFSAGNRILMGLGILALLGFLSHYYYQLHATLLVKSAILAASGVILLTARLLLHSLFPLKESKNA